MEPTINRYDSVSSKSSGSERMIVPSEAIVKGREEELFRKSSRWKMKSALDPCTMCHDD